MKWLCSVFSYLNCRSPNCLHGQNNEAGDGISNGQVVDQVVNISPLSSIKYWVFGKSPTTKEHRTFTYLPSDLFDCFPALMSTQVLDIMPTEMNRPK